MATRRIVVAGIALFAMLAFSTLMGVAQTGTPIPVGLIANLTGTDPKSSVHMTRGVELAVEEINVAGGINGRPIRLLTEDSQYRAPEAINAATKLYEVNKVEAAIMFGGSSLMIPVAELAQQKGKILLNTSSSSPKLPAPSRGRSGASSPSSTIMGKELGEWVASRGAKTAAFVVPNNTFGTGLADAAAAAFEAKGGKVVRRGRPTQRASRTTGPTSRRSSRPSRTPSSQQATATTSRRCSAVRARSASTSPGTPRIQQSSPWRIRSG